MTSTSRDSRRPSSIPAAKPPCQIHPSAVIAEKAVLVGTHQVTIGPNTILHPYAKIRAENGPVMIGANSAIYENAIVGTSIDNSNLEQAVIIGDYVNIESGAVVEAKSVGDGSVIDVNAVVGGGTVLGRWCRVGPLERVKDGEVLEDFTVVFGDGRKRIDSTARDGAEVRRAREIGQEKAVELVKKLVVDGKAKWVE
ncbi:transferase hexapeptide [Teratosphaeria destructans]|uniref:Dynactin subunit 6 n=1 Tax=Teratosphaeria destructans TaxID=418781 RepID=A0A9W7SJ14_9PEZI|nr:transferase hexapeptide [Teratosphaeria destructans]